MAAFHKEMIYFLQKKKGRPDKPAALHPVPAGPAGRPRQCQM
jgi:hypothetical protein